MQAKIDMSGFMLQVWIMFIVIFCNNYFVSMIFIILMIIFNILLMIMPDKSEVK